ncbi:MAG: aspartate kinase [Ignavibacteriaceae bacterium]
MKIIVQKYGGSSVADVTKIKKIAEMIAEVHRQDFAVVAVVSAMGKTTNSLIELAQQISQTPPHREMDMLLSTGERITMSLLCIALEELGLNAISLTGSQAGIITNDRHNDARVIEVRPFRIQDELEKGKVVVVGGFQGVSYKRDITTLGRGGSDTSAVALAAALDAERCEIYSDVDGVYSTDPAIVREAKHLPEVSYQQMQEMSFAGAKVLNAQAVQFAKEANIAIYARSTFQSGKETIVRKLAPGVSKGITAVVYESDLVRIQIKVDTDKFDWLMNYFKEKQIALKELNFSSNHENELQTNVSFLVSYKNVYGWQSVEEELKKNLNETIIFDYSLGAISLIGEGLNSDNGTLYETVSLLKKNGLKIFGITTTAFRISLLIPKEELTNGVQLLHKHWIS